MRKESDEVREIPAIIAEFFSRMWTDIEYFEYVMMNGGLIGAIGIPLLIVMLIAIFTNNDS